MRQTESESAGRVVIVDDSDVVRRTVSQHLIQAGYQVVAFDSGERFTDWLVAGSCDAVLLDSQMPGRSGLQVLTFVRQRFNRVELPVLFLTADHDPAHVAVALNSGANDFMVKPFDIPVLLARVELQVKLKLSQEQLTASLAQQRRVQSALEAQASVTLTELTLAAELQQQIFRAVEAPAYISIATHFQASSHVSGDILYSKRTPDGSTLCFVGDATGHGVAAALITMLVVALLESLPSNATGPSLILAWLNDQLAHYRMEDRYVTGIVVRIGPDGTLRAANAGHPAGIVLGAEAPRFIESSGTPLGWFQAVNYEDTIWPLKPGDQVLLYTDGLTERPNSRSEHWETGAVVNLAQVNQHEPPKALVQKLIDAASEHAGTAEPPDDVTVVALRYESATRG